MTAAVLILGGGEATRLPGKLAMAAGALPMIARVAANFEGAPEGWISGKATFAPELDGRLPLPLAIDRWSRRGPLAGMLSAMARMRARWVFTVAGDAPFVDQAFAEHLETLRRDGDEAVVPARTRDGERHVEPLAALYDRLAFVREGLPVLRSGRGALSAVIERLCARIVPLDADRIFTNVNTPDDYAALTGSLTER